MQAQEIAAKTTAMMPDLITTLEGLVAIPSVAFPGYPGEPVQRMAEETLKRFQEVGFDNARLMEVPTGYPPIYGEITGPPGSPVVMLYAHYDVQPAPPDQGWTSDPWTATHKDGRIYGRGAADDKSGLVAHLGTMRVFDGSPPCTVKLILEGMEETESNLEAFVEAHPELFACDVFIICDMGNLRVGEPVLSTALRGDVACVVTVRTLQHPLHSGVFGGGAPDAMMALVSLLRSLIDDEGNVAVEGVSRHRWDGADLSEDDFAASADLLDGVGLIGSGAILSRLWTKPSITTIGIDATSMEKASNTLAARAAAKISMRIAPTQDPQKAFELLQAHLEEHAPWGARVSVELTESGAGFAAQADGPIYDQARASFRDAWDVDPVDIGVGGSIPFISDFAARFPEAAILVTGVEDPDSRAHGANESLHLGEFARVCKAEAIFLARLGAMRS